MGLETAHSPNADDIATAYWVMLAIAGVIILAINAALVMVLVRYRAARGRRPSRIRGHGRIQVRAGGAFTAIAVVLFVLGVVYTERASDVADTGPDGLAAATQLTAQRGLDLPEGETEPLRIRAVGQQWLWRYEYPAESGNTPSSGGASDSFAQVFSYYELVVPVDTTVVLDIDSTDVVHRWWVPGLSGKFDADPGRLNRTWFRADETGNYDGQSAGFSGTSYAAMRTRVRVVSVEQYQAWLTEQAADIQAAQSAVQSQLSATGARPAETTEESQ